jgi:hypothetical protein
MIARAAGDTSSRTGSLCARGGGWIEGRELLEVADARLIQQGIRNPQRMTMVLAPGATRNG